MKELSIEERARRYDEAIEKAKCVIEQNPLMEYLRKGIEYIFPELKESEDEKIRKGIIRNLEYLMDRAEGFVKDELKERIAWLEKQGEHKPTDKIKPKFKVGDIVKHKDNPHLTYILKRFTDDGDYEFHAIGKDGNEGCTCFSVVKYQDEWELVEQKPTVEMKTPEESLGIDSDTYNKIVDECVYGEQKPAWSEEDEKMLNDILMCGEHHCYLDAGNITWLKSIKDKVQPQQKQEWSEEDSPYYDDICEILINLLCSETANVNKTAVQKDLDWLNSLKDRVQPKVEWSKEDKKVIHCLEYTVRHFYEDEDTIKWCCDWLKSLRPQSTWKPSDEQMEALEHFVRSIGESGYASPYDNDTKLLYSLLFDLKKLKEK